MKKKNLTLLFVFLSVVVIKSQSHRFYYQYQFVPDSTKIDSIITETTRLEVFKDHSEFVSEMSAKRDSALTKSAEKQTGEIGTALPDGKFKNKIWKSKDKMYSTEHIGIEPFKVINDKKFEWKLTNEVKKIQNYLCQKANLTYGKRIWEAWFTNEIPIQDGPHIFRDLPGFIVQMKDSKNHHVFELIGNAKTQNSNSNIIEKKMFRAIEVNRKQFNKKWQDFRKNPIGGTEQFMIINPQISQIRMYDESGNEMNMNDVRNKDREGAKKILKTSNNYLELDLYE